MVDSAHFNAGEGLDDTHNFNFDNKAAYPAFGGPHIFCLRDVRSGFY